MRSRARLSALDLPIFVDVCIFPFLITAAMPSLNVTVQKQGTNQTLPRTGLGGEC